MGFTPQFLSAKQASQAKARTGSRTPKECSPIWECSRLRELSNCEACFAEKCYGTALRRSALTQMVVNP